MAKVEKLAASGVCVLIRTAMPPFTWHFPVPAYEECPLDLVWKLVGEVRACCGSDAGFNTNNSC